MRQLLFCITLILAHYLCAQTEADNSKMLITSKSGIEKVQFLNELANQYSRENPDMGLKYANEAYELALELNSQSEVANSLTNLGRSYWAKSDYYNALKKLQTALAIYTRIGNLKDACSLHIRIGVVYKSLSEFEKALEEYLIASEISQENDFMDIYLTAVGNIGSLYLKQNNYTQALAYAEKAIELSEKIENQDNVGAFYNTIGGAYNGQKNFELALVAYKKSLALNIASENKYGETISLLNIGTTEFELKNFNDAVNYFNESLALSSKIKDNLGVYYAYLNLGLAKKEQRDFNSALIFFEKAHGLAIALDLMQEKLDIYKNFSEVFEFLDQPNQSILYLRKYIALNDTLFNENRSKQIAEMQSKYDSEQKERENEILRKNSEIQALSMAKQLNLRNSLIGITILIALLILILLNRYRLKKKANQLLQRQKVMISQQRDQLQETVAAKDKFFSIISHDLRSPFQNILGMINLLSDGNSEINEKQKKHFVHLLKKQTKSSYELLNNLLTWAQTQTGSLQINKEPIDLRKICNRSIAPYQFNATSKNIMISNQIPPDTVLSIDQNSASVFIGNLVNNAIKFTPEGGKISIDYKETPNTAVLNFSDSGVGMPPETIKKLFRLGEDITTKGTKNEKGTGLGLLLCKELINMNGGSISVTSEVGQGSMFTILIPK